MSCTLLSYRVLTKLLLLHVQGYKPEVNIEPCWVSAGNGMSHLPLFSAWYMNKNLGPCTHNGRQPFSYRMKMVDLESIFVFCPFLCGKNWHKLRKVY